MKLKEIVLSEKIRCRENGKPCHEHTNPIRNFIHDLHCYWVGCPYAKLDKYKEPLK